MALRHDPKVAVLMGTFNGGDFLSEQLNSVSAQTGVQPSLVVSDDGSTDDTLTCVKAFADSSSVPTKIIDGPAQGFSANYMSLLAAMDETAAYVALADQDDVWLPDKLSAAVACLAQAPPDVPALYCGARIIWHWEEDVRKPDRPVVRPVGFANALIENIASGNTIVMNNAAVRLVRQAARQTGPVFAHDWWLYLLISGSGGAVYYDHTPRILYRQHAQNALGDGFRGMSSVVNKVNVLRGVWQGRVQGNLDALDQLRNLLTEDSERLCDLFEAARGAPLVTRVRKIRDLKIYRQGRLSNVMFWGAVVLGRI